MNESMVLIVVSVVIVAILTVVIFLVRYSRRRVRLAAGDDDGSRCVACGSSDLDRPAPGVYRCVCGYEGGPALGDYQWARQCERLAAMPADKRQELLATTIEQTTFLLETAKSDLSEALAAFSAGDAIVPLGKHGAIQKTELFDQVRALLPDVQSRLLEAIAGVELVRHLTRGGGRMTEWYDKLRGSREGVLTITGMQASAALRAELRENLEMLGGLERELRAR